MLVLVRDLLICQKHSIFLAIIFLNKSNIFKIYIYYKKGPTKGKKIIKMVKVLVRKKSRKRNKKNYNSSLNKNN